MPVTRIHKAFAPFKKYTPTFLWRSIRSLGIATLTPLAFALNSGHLRSSFANKAVDAKGEPLPWYTYPMIEFLVRRSFTGRSVLEFGGGQSTFWWATRVEELTTIEEDADWVAVLRKKLPPGVLLRHVPLEGFSDIRPFLASCGRKYDVIIVDGHKRREVTRIAFEYLKDHGAIILDNAEGYNFYEEIKDRGYQRVDFWGYAPGVFLPHCTSLVFKDRCFMLSAEIPFIS